MTVHVFGGPTIGADEVLARLPQAVFHPPIAHGDLLRLSPDAASVFVLVDGFFHQRAPVRHKEILYALGKRATVVGASSMGALRAAEMHTCGMVGVGQVFRDYMDGVIESDDEVAVAHAEDGAYRPLSEPLVNIRYAVAAACRAGALPVEAAQALIMAATALPYHERSWEWLERARAADGAHLSPWVHAVRGFLAESPQWANLKKRDALRALDLVRSGRLNGTSEPNRHEAGTSYFRQWQAAVASRSGGTAGRTPVPDLRVIEHAQLYAADFPDRWRAYVLAKIVRGAPGMSGVLEAAEARGIGVDDVNSEGVRHWLTAEDERFDPQERLLRALTRSYREEPGYRPFYSITDELRALVPSWEESERHVRAALKTEAMALRANPARSARTLRADAVIAHLVRYWQTDATDARALDGAARDRGFLGIDQAVEAARVFFLEQLRTQAPARRSAFRRTP